MGDAVSTLLFQPPPPSKLKQNKIVWMKTSKGTQIPAFYISYRRQGGVESCRSLTAEEIRDSSPQEGITILYSHANAEDLGSIYPWCKFLSKMLHVNLFAYDYTGYGMAYDSGKSSVEVIVTFSYRRKRVLLSFHFLQSGPPSEDHCYSDIEAAYDYLRNVLKIPSRNIVLYGRSLGSGPSCHLAVKTGSRAQDEETGRNDGPVGGLILHAPFLSVYRVVIDTGCTLPGDKFPNVDLLSMVKSPTILVHGTNDQIVPFHHSERLYETIPEEFRARPIYIEGMSHNNVHAQVRPLFCDRLAEFLEDSVWPNAVVRGRGAQHVIRARTKIWKMVDHEFDYEEDSAKKALGL